MKKGNKSNEILAMCSHLYNFFSSCNIKPQLDSLSEDKEENKLHREHSSFLLLLRKAVKACQSTDTWNC